MNDIRKLSTAISSFPFYLRFSQHKWNASCFWDLFPSPISSNQVFVQDGTQDNEAMSDRSANTEAEDGPIDEEEDINEHLRTMAEQKNWIKVTLMLALLLLWSTRGWLTLSSLSPFSPCHLSCLFHLCRCFYKPFSPCLIFSDNQGLMDISLLTANANQLRQAFDQCEPFRSDMSVVKWHVCVDFYE